MKPKLKQDALIQKLDATIVEDIDKLYEQAALHVQAREAMGAGYLKVWEDETGRSISKLDALHLRQLYALPLFMLPGIKENVPPKLSSLRYLLKLTNTKDAEKFLRAAIKDKALTPSSTRDALIELAKMWVGAGMYDRMWSSDGKKAQVVESYMDAKWRTEMMKEIKEILGKEIHENSCVEYLVQTSLPLEQSDFDDPNVITKNMKKELRKMQLAYEAAYPRMVAFAKWKKAAAAIVAATEV
jgi:hypothetical protein